MANKFLTSRQPVRTSTILIVAAVLLFGITAMVSTTEAVSESDKQSAVILAFLNSNCDVETDYCEAEHNLVALGDRALKTLREVAETGPPKSAVEAFVEYSGELWDENQAFLRSEEGKKYAAEYSKINGKRTREEFIRSETAIFVEGYKYKSILGVKLIKGEEKPTGLSAPPPPTIYGEEIDNECK